MMLDTASLLIFGFGLSIFANERVSANATARRGAYTSLVKEIQGRKINPLIPPFPDKGPVPIELSFELHRVIDLDSDAAILTVAGIMRAAWTDNRYAWTDPSQPDFILLPASSVWMPEFMLVSSPTFTLRMLDALLMVKRNGDIVVEKTVLEKVSCHVSVRLFPRDVQHCSLTFVPSISYRGVVIPAHQTISGLDRSSNVGEEWTLMRYIQTLGNITIYHSDGKISKSPAFIASMLISRNHAFYFLTIIIPTMMLAAMTLVPYAIPPSQSGPKLIIPVTTFLSFNIYMLLLEKTLPKAAKLPVLGQSYAAMLFVGLITEVSQAIAVKFYSCRIKTVPRLLEFIYFRILAYIFCFHICHGSKYRQEAELDSSEVQKVIHKKWLSIGRITDRMGLVLAVIVIAISLMYLFVNILNPPPIPPIFKNVVTVYR